MSISRNHHYISQVHIKKFFNNSSEIYLHYKSTKITSLKKSSKNIFSAMDLNTKYENSENDYISIENELNKNFEKDFDIHYFNIIKLIKEETCDLEIQRSLLYLARYGTIANFRNPQSKQNLNNLFFENLKPHMDIAIDSLKQSFYDFFNNRGDAKYLSTGNYLELSTEILNKMGLIYFVIETPEKENDFFLLPDFGAVTTREKINSYFNPDIEEIAYIGMPLSSKIYLHFYSEKHTLNLNMSFITKLDSEQVYALNKDNFHFANEIVACENKEYLDFFLQRLSN